MIQVSLLESRAGGRRAERRVERQTEDIQDTSKPCPPQGQSSEGRAEFIFPGGSSLPIILPRLPNQESPSTSQEQSK